MNKPKSVLIGVIAALLLTGCANGQDISGNSGAGSSGNSEPFSAIGAKEAEKAALDHAGFTDGQVTFTKTEYERGGGKYEIEFTADGYKYEYDINAADGSISEFSKKMIAFTENASETVSTSAVTSSDNAQTDIPETVFSDPISAAGTTQSAQSTQSAQPTDTPQSAATAPPAQSTSSAAGGITLEEAETTALDYVGLTSAEVTFTKTKLDHDGYSDKYEIEFETAYYEYEFEIGADSGDVISFSKEAKKHAADAASGSISLEEAKTAALTHSGLTAADVTFTKTESNHDEYEIEFVTADYEYEYEIDSGSGEVMSYSKEAIKILLTDPPSGAISVDEAKKAALDHAGLTESETIFTKIKLYTDDGRTVYKLIFHTGRQHYEYAVDALTGGIIGWHE